MARDTAIHTKVLLTEYGKAFTPERLEAFRIEALALAEALVAIRRAE